MPHCDLCEQEATQVMISYDFKGEESKVYLCPMHYVEYLKFFPLCNMFPVAGDD